MSCEGEGQLATSVAGEARLCAQGCRDDIDDLDIPNEPDDDWRIRADVGEEPC